MRFLFYVDRRTKFRYHKECEFFSDEDGEKTGNKLQE
jgi:hypothetical protein